MRKPVSILLFVSGLFAAAALAQDHSFLGRLRLRGSILTSTTDAARVNADAAQDTEPSIGVNIQGANETDYLGWIHWDYPGNISVRGAIIQRVNGAVTQTTLIAPAHNAPSTGDPVVVVNHADTGVNPRRAYMFYTDRVPDGYSSISVSSSNNGFATATTVSSVNDGITILDKPAAAVSEYAGSLGDVYCAFVINHTDGCEKDTRIVLYRLDPASGSWYAAGDVPLPFDHRYLHSPSVAIDATNGHVYLSYIDQVHNFLYMVHGTPFQGGGGLTFLSFDALQSIGASAAFYYNGPLCASNGDSPYTGFLEGLGTASNSPPPTTTEAVSMLTSRYNNADHSIGLVYHGYTGSTGTHLFLTRYVPGSPTPFASVRQIGAAPNDQWNGALDDDAQGRYLVTYYAGPTGSASYQFCSQLTGADGTAIGAESCWAVGYACGACGPVTPTLGEYQDVAYANGVWRAATVSPVNANNYYDIYELTIQP